MNDSFPRRWRGAFLLCWAMFLVGGGWTASRAGDGIPPVATPEEAFAWTVEVQHKKERKPPDPSQAAAYKRLMDSYPLLLRETVEKVGANWHRVRLYDNRRKDEVWVYKGAVVFQLENFVPDKVSVVSIRDPAAPVKAEFGPCFPDLDWVRREVFVKTVNYHGHRCDYYEDKDAPALDGGDRLTPSTVRGAQAWIDVKTRLPVAVEDADMVKKFTYADDPPTALEPTGIFAAAYRRSVPQANFDGNPNDRTH